MTTLDHTLSYFARQTMICFCLVITAFLSHLIPLSQQHSEWIAFFLMGLMIPVSCYLTHSSIMRYSEKSVFLCFSGLTGVCFIIIIAKASKFLFKTFPLSPSLWVMALMLSTSFLITQRIVASAIKFKSSNHRYLFFSIHLAWTILAWCALFQLPNWSAYMEACASHPYRSIGLTIVCWLITQAWIKATPINMSESYKGNAILFSILFLCLSFRSDSLFQEGSYAFHWAYFVGPVETIRHHGWLLWDTPSQYGFLNIFLVSILPIKSAWQAMYVFQSTLLFIASLIFYHCLNSSTRSYRWILGLMIGLCALHFADPALEGPAPYPSSSVMRFFWCYVLVFVTYSYWKSEAFTFKKWTGYGSLAWLCSMLWSGESAIYGSCIFLPALWVACLQQYASNNWQNTLKNFFRKKGYLYLIFPFFLLLNALTLISLYYRIALGHSPEWMNHFMYGLLYARGFGAFPLSIKGSVWILILLLITLVTLFNFTLKDNPLSRTAVLALSLVGCLWSISSYFIGRAVPNNITAILPLLFLLISIGLQIANQQKSKSGVWLMQVTASPLIFIMLFTVFGNPLLSSQVLNLKTYSSHINHSLPKMNTTHELMSLIKETQINQEDPIVYSGESALLWTDSNYSFEYPALPSPLQILETPVPEERQQLIIHRFITRRAIQQFYLIHAKSEALEPYKKWRTLIQNYYSISKVFETKHWKIIQYQIKV